VIQGRGQHRLSLMDEMLEQWALLERSRRKFRFLLRKTETTDKTSETLRQMLHADADVLALLGSRIKQARDAFYEDGARLETRPTRWRSGCMPPACCRCPLYSRCFRAWCAISPGSRTRKWNW